MKQKKLTVIGFCDPIVVVFKLRKHWYAEFVLIGRANEPGRGRVKERRETRRRKELLMNRSPSLRRHNKNTRGLILLISELKFTDTSLDMPFPLSSPWRRRTGTGADLASAAVEKPTGHLTILFSTWWPGLEIGPGLSPSP
ncbi:hypothetical protein BHM03_00015105 [Ensete ventricosum]|nr:hypothetical protein BHM03_00015105 [Ensete ventricosum]